MKDDDEVRKYFARTIGEAFLREAYHRDTSARQACFQMHADPASVNKMLNFKTPFTMITACKMLAWMNRDFELKITPRYEIKKNTQIKTGVE